MPHGARRGAERADERDRGLSIMKRLRKMSERDFERKVRERVSRRGGGVRFFGGIAKVREWIFRRAPEAGLEFWDGDDGWVFGGRLATKDVSFAFNEARKVSEAYLPHPVQFTFDESDWPSPSQLPIDDDVLDEIFTWLDARDLWSCMQVSTRWRRVASTRELWKQLPGSHLPERVEREASIRITEHGSQFARPVLWQAYAFCYPWIVPCGFEIALTDRKGLRFIGELWHDDVGQMILATWTKYYLSWNRSIFIAMNMIEPYFDRRVDDRIVTALCHAGNGEGFAYDRLKGELYVFTDYRVRPHSISLRFYSDVFYEESDARVRKGEWSLDFFHQGSEAIARSAKNWSTPSDDERVSLLA